MLVGRGGGGVDGGGGGGEGALSWTMCFFDPSIVVESFAGGKLSLSLGGRLVSGCVQSLTDAVWLEGGYI